MNYRKENNTYFATPKDDVSDRIQVEIGDASDLVNFKPQVKVKRWDGEVAFSALLTHAENNPTESVDGDSIVWAGEKTSARFYPTADGDDGGFEFEVILSEAPAGRKIRFTVDHKDLVYHWQGPLTDEIRVGDDGGRVASVTSTDAFDSLGNVLIHRPENVVGSYAVFAAVPRKNETGGKVYRAGKVGHIYRPKVFDSVGNWAWEDLEINGNALTITIPKSFLDIAVFPITSRGVNFGYETAGGTVSAHYDDQRFCWATPTSGGPGVSMTLRSRVSTGTATGVMGLYTHANGALVSNSQTDRRSYTSTTPAWNTDNFGATKPTIVGSTKYWLSTYGGENSTNYIYIYWDAGDTGKGGTIDPQAYSGTENLPATVSPTAQSRIYSLYCTYDIAISGAGAIASVEAFGSPSLSATVSPAGIAGAEAFGTATVSVAGSDISGAGNIGTAEALGSPTLSVAVSPSGIASAGALGSPTLSVTASLTGIASSEAVGSPALSVVISPVGIAGAESFGAAALSLAVSPTGIHTAEAFGTPALSASLSPAGIGSAEVFGVATISTTYDISGAGNISSAEAFGTPGLSLAITPAGIDGAESFGTATVSLVYDIADAGNIASAETFGSPALGVDIFPDGIASAEAFGLATVSMAGEMNISGAGNIPSAETFGTPTISIVTQYLCTVSDALINQVALTNGLVNQAAVSDTITNQAILTDSLVNQAAIADALVHQVAATDS